MPVKVLPRKLLLIRVIREGQVGWNLMVESNDDRSHSKQLMEAEGDRLMSKIIDLIANETANHVRLSSDVA